MKEEYDFSEARRGPVVPMQAGRTRITISVDNDVLDWFRGRVHEMGGGDYRDLMNAVLREAVRGAARPADRTPQRENHENKPGYVSGVI